MAILSPKIVSDSRRLTSAVRDFDATGRNKLRRGPQLRPTSFTFRARITAISGSFPQWSYTCQRVIGFDSSLTGAAQDVTDGVDLTACKNTSELTGTPPYYYGNGVPITSSSGQANSSMCVIQALGVGSCVDLTVCADRNGGSISRRFTRDNSAF
jgi:hypothetical protein